jgi:hypothetical protein
MAGKLEAKRMTGSQTQQHESHKRRISMVGKAYNKVARIALAMVLVVLSFAFALGPVQPAHAQGLGYGQSIVGQISGSNLHEWHEFRGNAGDLIRIAMERTSGNLDPFVDVWLRNGGDWVSLVDDDDSGGNWNALIDSYVLPESGTYLIGTHRSDHEYGTTSGSYLLTLSLLPDANGCAADDSDCDGFSNDFESWVAETFKPVLVFDEEEPQCVDVVNQTATVYQVTPHTTAGRYGKSGALLTVVVLYPEDCGMYGTGTGGHPGDTEALRLFVTNDVLNFDGPAGWRIHTVLMKRHYDDWEAYDASDFAYRGTHPVVYVSESKHAMYHSLSACENYALMTFEDCGGGTSLTLFTPPEHNVGERGAPAFDAMRHAPSSKLASLFSDSQHTEYTWTDTPFCGGWVGTPCSGSVSGKWWPNLNEWERAFQAGLLEEAVAR